MAVRNRARGVREARKIYINEFVCGVIFGAVVEFLILLFFAMRK